VLQASCSTNAYLHIIGSWSNRSTIPEFSWRDWGKSRKKLRIASVLAEIWTDHFSNISLPAYSVLSYDLYFESWCSVLS
jgi:hypothetical protein